MRRTSSWPCPPTSGQQPWQRRARPGPRRAAADEWCQRQRPAPARLQSPRRRRSSPSTSRAASSDRPHRRHARCQSRPSPAARSRRAACAPPFPRTWEQAFPPTPRLRARKHRPTLRARAPPRAPRPRGSPAHIPRPDNRGLSSLEAFLQFHQSPADPAFHRSQRHLRPVRQIGIGQPAEKGRTDRHLRPVLKLADAACQQPRILARFNSGERIRPVVGDLRGSFDRIEPRRPL